MALTPLGSLWSTKASSVGAVVVVGAEIDIEGDGKVLAHIEAPRRHRRAGLAACRRQGEDMVAASKLALPCGVSVTAAGGGVTVTLTAARSLR